MLTKFSPEEVGRIVARVRMARELRVRVSTLEAERERADSLLEAARAELESLSIKPDEENIFDVVSLAFEVAAS